MTKNRRKGGFTLAEMLIVVAIIVILMGVSFVAVQSYQSSSTRLELDTIAKEIFIAAQNHLTEAESQGLISKLDKGSLGFYDDTLGEDKINGKQEVYYVLNDGNNNEVLDLLLPRYAVDPTVLSGSYVIRYQPSTGTVLDVFYSRPGNPTFLTRAGTTFTDGEYSTLMGTTPNYRAGGENNRVKYDDNKIIGWYGGEKPIPTGERLRAPTFEIHNEETLWVRVTDTNTSAQINYNIKLIVKGKISGAEAYFSIVENKLVGTGPRLQSNGTDIILDDITESGLHFAQITPDKGAFIPGEDLIIQAVAYSTDALANVAMSAEKTTNSLFADPVPYKTDAKITGSDIENNVVGIANFRHFENLDATVSKLGENSTADEFDIGTAGQITDLDWKSFNDTEGDIIPISGTVSAGSLLPVTPAYSSNGKIVPLALSYDGQNNKILNVTVNHSGTAGLFGELAANSTVKDLELIDFSIKSTSGSAGALVGTATGEDSKKIEITNVLAYNKTLTGTSTTITGTGSVGGLIGSATNCTVSKCAAALVVTSTGGDAGGLIGTSSGGTVEASYSGGHTKDAKYFDGSTPIYNVTASDKAGGLIGNAGSTGISFSYSTCSATGATAGGLVGTSSGDVTGCYCTGLVQGTTTMGAFAGELTGTASNCQYFEIINEIKKDDEGNDIAGYNYLKPLGKTARDETNGITAFDESTATYQTFSGSPEDDWKTAVPYDENLTRYYGSGTESNKKPRYNLQTVAQIVENAKKEDDTITISVKDNDFVSTHYGDWPAPEILVFNTASNS